MSSTSRIIATTIAGILGISLLLSQVPSAVGINYVYCPSGGGVCNGTPYDDYIFGSDNNDIIYAGAGNDIVWGKAGNDTILGEDGSDYLYGDFTSGSLGADNLYGGNGNDYLHHDGSYHPHNQPDYKQDWLHCGSGTDYAYYKTTAGDNDQLITNHGCENLITASQ